jgi:hypothetical protein
MELFSHKSCEAVDPKLRHKKSDTLYSELGYTPLKRVLFSAYVTSSGVKQRARSSDVMPYSSATTQVSEKDIDYIFRVYNWIKHEEKKKKKIIQMEATCFSEMFSPHYTAETLNSS